MSTLVPAVEEMLKESTKVKYLKPDNSWNKEGLLSHFNESEDVMTTCASSGIPLFYTTKTGKIYKLEAFGNCQVNGKPYHWTQLKIPGDVSKPDYPVEYEGYVSIEESKKDLTDKELSAILKEHGI